MSIPVATPQVSVNEEFVTLVKWEMEPRSAVSSDDVICSVETSKAVFEVTAGAEGYLQPVVALGEEVAIGAPLAFITDQPDVRVDTLKGQSTANRAEGEVKKWTKKALIVAKHLGVDIEALFTAKNGETVTETDVRNASKNADNVRDLMDDVYSTNRAERVILLCGAAGGGMIALDALSRNPRQRAVGILDNNPKAHGKSVMGVPVLGGTELAEKLWNDQRCDAMINTFVDTIEDRRRQFDNLRKLGIKFTNIVDPTVHIGLNVEMGVGNLILGNSYIATGSRVGDNNFMASHTCIEHHNRVGSHCTFGPRTTTSGGVTIGDRVKTGIGVCFEPYLKIGPESVIASGCFITTDIPARSWVKAQVSHVIRPRH